MVKALLRRFGEYYWTLPHRWRTAGSLFLHIGIWLCLLLTMAIPHSSWLEWGMPQRMKFGLAFFSLVVIFYYHCYDLLPRQIGSGKILNYLFMMVLLIVFFELIHYRLVYDLQMFIVWSAKDNTYIIDPGNYKYWLAGPQVTPLSRLLFWSFTLGWGWGRYLFRSWFAPKELVKRTSSIRLLWSLHVLFWFFLIASNWAHLGVPRYNLIETGAVLFLAGVFYMNYYLLNRLDLARGWYRYLLLLLLLIIIAWPTDAWLQYININRHWGGVLVSDRQYSYLEVLFGVQHLIFWMVIILSWVYYFFERNVVERTLALQTESESRQAQLSNLKSQIQPHFMLNVLNGLYADALEEGSSKTAAGIVQVSQMMQYMIYEADHQEILLEKEIAFLKQYVSLQQARLPDTISVSATWPDPGMRAHLIAPLLLLSPIENAFKHGVSLQRPSMINIILETKKDRLKLQVENSLHPERFLPEAVQRGIGLKNLQSRLALLYPKRHQLDINRYEGKFVVILIINSIKT